MHADRFSTQALGEAPEYAVVPAILAAALNAVDPGAAVRRALRREGHQLLVGEHTYHLNDYRRIWLLGAGKAGAAMAEAIAEVIGDRLSGGLVVVKDTPGAQVQAPAGAAYRLVPAEHPIPDERGVAAGVQIAAQLAELSSEDLVIAPISGGGSALLTCLPEQISLADMRALTNQLLACGARIDEINLLRRRLDLLKGGGFAQVAYPATVLALLLSDVVGSSPATIASGPTVPDTGDFAQAWAVLKRYNLIDMAPPAIVAYLQQGIAGAVPLPPEPDDPCFRRTTSIVIGDNRIAAEAACAAAARLGMNPLLLSSFVQGEAREIGRMLAAIGRELAYGSGPVARPACIVIGGETTVTLRGDGRGGRNQELALGAVPDLAGLERVLLVTLATDGDDGPTDAAGAVVTGTSAQRAAALGLDPANYLARNDAYSFFDQLGDLLRSGSSGTNVNDLALVMAW